MGFRLVPKLVTSMTLNGVMANMLRYFAEFGIFRGQFHKSGSLAINKFSPQKRHKVQQLSTTDLLCMSW